MIYPEAVGARLMHQPTKQQITSILSKAQPRIVGDGFRTERRAGYGERFAIYCAAIRECGGWTTADQLADRLDLSPHYAQNQLSALARSKKLLRRFIEGSCKREYGLP